jgi:hypothetical protein
MLAIVNVLILFLWLVAEMSPLLAERMARFEAKVRREQRRRE